MLDMVVATTKIAGQQATRLQIARGNQQNRVAVDDVVLCAGQHAAVGVAVEGEAQLGSTRDHFPGDKGRMQRAAVQIDVVAVGRDVQQSHLSAQPLE
jgi:hypothetical protein